MPENKTWFMTFMHGWTVFHTAGISLMLFGTNWGAKGTAGGKDILGTGFELSFTITAAQVFGFAIFVYELVKAKLRKK